MVEGLTCLPSRAVHLLNQHQFHLEKWCRTRRASAGAPRVEMRLHTHTHTTVRTPAEAGITSGHAHPDDTLSLGDTNDDLTFRIPCRTLGVTMSSPKNVGGCRILRSLRYVNRTCCSKRENFGTSLIFAANHANNNQDMLKLTTLCQRKNIHAAP